ncbi:MAG TPA: acetyl-CoA carboxylase carboxyltransferase subunit alpha [Terracidiphilus sp.]|jgi:acetyl-CoA carboxylase carboxyl transferase subunit alpha|nr:acetyl-CoA carboxylase carboxyltransferase subunit alpha [Terracidiphilus sp.]
MMSEQEAGNSAEAQAASAAWSRVERARHPQRPYPMDLIERIFTDFSEIHGDRAFGDDEAIVCGMARLDGEEVLVIGIRKGGTTKERIKRNFGMPSPEGYRKALRVMKLAEKFARPVVAIIDVTAAYPGLGAEERGQAEAIARNIREMSRLRVPTISVITGEGGSGGALALAVTDKVLILENAVYSVIPPEGAAAIMWRDTAHKARAAAALRVTAQDVAALGCVDEIIPEPEGGIHADPEKGTELLVAAIRRHLAALKAMTPEAMLAERHRKFRNIAQFYTESPAAKTGSA